MRFSSILSVAVLAAAITAVSATIPSGVVEALPESVAAVVQPRAEAQCAMNRYCVTSDVKGAVGLGLVGAELGLVLPAAFGLRETWAFIVFPIVGGVGGAIGGWAIDSNVRSPELSVALLVAGAALVIPAIVLTLQLTAYNPDADPAIQNDDDGSYEEAPSDAAPPPAAASPSAMGGPGGVLRFGANGIFLGIPDVAPRPSYTSDEVRMYGLRADAVQTEWHVTLLSGAL